MPMGDYLSLLRRDGTFVQCGNPEDGLFQVPAPALISRRIKLTGSLVGSPAEIQEMLALAVEKKVVPMVEVRSMKEANKAIVDMELGIARYRYVLVNE
jgi:alcohol dehydrogenase (NADP+)